MSNELQDTELKADMDQFDNYYALISFYLQISNLDNFKIRWSQKGQGSSSKLTLKDNLLDFLKENYEISISELVNIENLLDNKLRIDTPVPSTNGEKFIYHIPLKNKEFPQMWLYDQDKRLHLKITDEGPALGTTKSFWNDSDTIYYYNKDPNHDEKYQIFSYTVETNTVEQLTFDNDVNNLVDMLNNDELLVYKNKTSDFQFYSFSLTNKTFTPITTIEGGIQTTAGIYIHMFDLLAKDKTKLIFPHNNALWLYDFTTKQTKELYKLDNTILTPMQWHANNKEIYFTSNHLDKNIIGSFDITTKGVTWIGNTDYENSFGIATDKFVFVKVFKEGSNKLAKYDFKGTFIQELPLEGSVYGFLYQRQKNIFLKTSSFDFEIKYFSYNQDSDELTSYFDFYDPKTATDTKIKYDYLTIPSYDTQVSTFILKPKNFDPSKKYPVIVNLHGGPYNHYSNIYDELVPKILNFGFIIVLPNPSGSTGYGREFNKRITISDQHINMGRKDIADIDTIVAYLSNLPYIQKDNFIITGASYGGYLTWMYAVKGKYRSQVKKIIPLLSITSFELITDVKNNQILRHIVQAFVMENLLPDILNEKDEQTRKKYQEMLREASPLTYIRNLTADCMMIQSGTDQRTTRAHTDAVLKELQKIYPDGIPFKLQYEILEGFGHNFSSDLIQKVGLFLLS